MAQSKKYIESKIQVASMVEVSIPNSWDIDVDHNGNKTIKVIGFKKEQVMINEIKTFPAPDRAGQKMLGYNKELTVYFCQSATTNGESAPFSLDKKAAEYWGEHDDGDMFFDGTLGTITKVIW